ncbi:hypothetical protein V8F20_010843 [Naviculisporaceae sp. PSN 640]
MAPSTPRANTTSATRSSVFSTPRTAPSAASADADSASLLSVQVAAFRAKVICHLMTPKIMDLGANYGYRDLDSVASYLKSQISAASPVLYKKLNASFAQPHTIAYVSVDMHHLKSWELTVRSMPIEDRKVWLELSEQADSDKTRPLSPEYLRYHKEREQQHLDAENIAKEMTELCAGFVTPVGDEEDVCGPTFDLVPGLLRSIWCIARSHKDGRGRISNKHLKHIILQVWMTGLEHDPVMDEAARRWCSRMGVNYDEIMGNVTIKYED